MRPEPLVACDGKVTPITGRQGELLRLFVLHEGEIVTKIQIARLRQTSQKDVGSKVRYLREQLESVGCAELLETDRSIGYRLNLNGWQVDARDFKSTIEALGDGFDEDVTSLLVNEAAAADDVKRLTGVLGMWHSNPAAGIPKFEERFEALKIKAENNLLMARLSTCQPNEIREAIQELEHRIRTAAEDFVWMFLLLAYDAIGNVGKVDATIERIESHYRGHVPVRVEELMEAMKRAKVKNPFRVDDAVAVVPPLRSSLGPERLSTDDSTLQALCRTLGITTASELRLGGSHLTPLACINRTRKRLYFSGVLASKWVIEPAIRSEFNELLTRLDENGGEARFLVINPNGDGFKRLRELRAGNISTESIEPLLKLVKQHRSLKVRAYDSLPAFRIIVIDDDVVTFSPYRLSAEAYRKTDRGWEAPHVALDPLASHPLAEAFELLFLETWNKSIELEACQ